MTTVQIRSGPLNGAWSSDMTLGFEPRDRKFDSCRAILNNKGETMNDVMTPEHPRWQEFIDRLEGSEGCNFRKNEEGKITWKCNGTMERPLARAILEDMEMDVEESFEFFNMRDGYCDCEILWNVA